MNQDLISYYRDRANEYDLVYAIPEEQADLIKATKIFQDLFRDKSVLEIACGTGYWTERISKSAASIMATDINDNVLEIAKSRARFTNVTFAVTDMYNLPLETKYNALFGGFIWSHILLQDLDSFLSTILRLLKPNAVIAFIDSKKVGSHVNIKTTTDDQGNTYQIRNLKNKTTHAVLKNFPSQEFLFQTLSKSFTDIKFFELDYYWVVSCRFPG